MLFISSTGPTSNQLERAVQYTYRLYQAKRGCTPNEPVHSREILVIPRFVQEKLNETSQWSGQISIQVPLITMGAEWKGFQRNCIFNYVKLRKVTRNCFNLAEFRRITLN